MNRFGSSKGFAFVELEICFFGDTYKKRESQLMKKQPSIIALQSFFPTANVGIRISFGTYSKTTHPWED